MRLLNPIQVDGLMALLPKLRLGLELLGLGALAWAYLSLRQVRPIPPAQVERVQEVQAQSQSEVVRRGPERQVTRRTVARPDGTRITQTQVRETAGEVRVRNSVAEMQRKTVTALPNSRDRQDTWSLGLTWEPSWGRMDLLPPAQTLSLSLGRRLGDSPFWLEAGLRRPSDQVPALILGLRVSW